jgi:hypothetical protein
MDEGCKCKMMQESNSISINMQKVILLITTSFFIFINYLTKYLKINNMIFMNLTMFYDFLPVIHINRSCSTKNDYFSKQD